jgi:hypothetical protein
VKEQGKVIEEYKTQVLLPCTKIDPAIIQDLQLAPVELTPQNSQLYDNIQILDKILLANQTSLDLAKLYTKAKFEQEKT